MRERIGVCVYLFAPIKAFPRAKKTSMVEKARVHVRMYVYARGDIKHREANPQRDIYRPEGSTNLHSLPSMNRT